MEENKLTDEEYSRENFANEQQGELKPLKPLATFLYVAFGAFSVLYLTLLAVLAIILMIGNGTIELNPSEANDILKSLTDAETLLDGLNIMLYILCIISFCLWIYRANKNLHSYGLQRITYTPAWAVGWNFIPIAFYWMPFQVMQEIWKGSKAMYEGTDKDQWRILTFPAMLSVWWATYIGGSITGSIGKFYLREAEETLNQDDVFTGTYYVICSIILILIAGVLVMKIVHDITKMQSSNSDLMD